VTSVSGSLDTSGLPLGGLAAMFGMFRNFGRAGCGFEGDSLVGVTPAPPGRKDRVPPDACDKFCASPRHSGLLETSDRIGVRPDSVQVLVGWALYWAAHPLAGVAHYRSAARRVPLTRRGSRGDCPARSSTAHLAVPTGTSTSAPPDERP
jgi:hypothetical protein